MEWEQHRRIRRESDDHEPAAKRLLAAYRADLEATGMFAENEVTSPARSFLMRLGPDGFLAMTVDQHLAVWGHDRRLVAWLIVTGRVRPTAEYLVASKPGREGCGRHLPRVPRRVPRGRGRAGV